LDRLDLLKRLSGERRASDENGTQTNRRVRRTPVSDPGLISEQIKRFAGARYKNGVRRHKTFWQSKTAQSKQV